MTTVNTSTLGAEVTALGKLIGLLSDGQQSGNVDINTDWFENPVGALLDADTRLNDLVELFSLMLELSPSNPVVFTDAQWYAIPNISSGGSTPFFIVAPKPSDTSGEIGLGVLSATGGAVSVDAYAYLPLFTFDSSGANWVAASDSHPVQIGLDASSQTQFAVDGVSFSALEVRGTIYLSLTAPEIQATFKNLSGTSKPDTYTSLQSLLDTDVETWLGEVLVQGSPWLDIYVGNLPYTAGDILEAAHFLSRDYHLVAGNLDKVSDFASVLSEHSDPVSAFLWPQFSTSDQQILSDPNSSEEEVQNALLTELNKVIDGPSIYDVERFEDVYTSPQTDVLITENPQGSQLVQLNRLLLQDAYQAFVLPSPFDLDLQNLQGSALQIGLNFVFAVVDALSVIQVPLIYLPGGGIFVVRRQNADDSVDYGLDFAVELSLNADSNPSNQPPSPEIDLCLGTWLSGENDTDNWYFKITNQGVQRGLSVFGLQRAKNGDLSFAPSFRLTSIGVNIKGGGNAPLIDVNGYSLEGAELRVYLDSTTWSYGFAARLDNVGFPLAPGFDDAQSGSGNMVAKNLLAGGSSSQSADPTKTSATNPAFSVEAGYVQGYDFLIELYDPNGQATDLIWFPIQKRFGPVSCTKIGLRVDVSGQYADDPVLGLLFDGGITVSALSIYLQQLEIDMHLKKITDIDGYSLDLQGLDIYFNSGGVEISAGLLKNTSQEQTTYDGEAIIKIEGFGISALGSFASLPDGGGTSLFVFAMLNVPLGGPGFFFVTGLSAGFGYNRRLILPDQNQIPIFPLVGGLTNPELIGGSNPTPMQALASLDDWVKPERGQYWLAAGIQFTTYEIINSTGLLIVEFGNDFTISLIGTSILKQLPGNLDDTFVYAELDIEVIFDVGEGEFKASASLATSSYVLYKEVHLTGGFAFYAWFGSNQYAGDFAFTMGGYHPAFIVPDYYPKESRLGINWKVDDSLSLTGGAYFAITPAAMMAGAQLDLTFQAGGLKAWFKANVDAILYYKPFYIDALIEVSVGVSYRMKVWFVDTTLSIEIGAQFHFWAPPVGASVYIDWYIISFTISFGDDPNPSDTLDWDEFKGLLPTKTTVASNSASPKSKRRTARVESEATQTSTTSEAYLHINANAGLLRTQTEEEMTFWLVRAGTFTFTAGSAIPATSVVVDGSQGNQTLTGNPMGVQRLNGGIKPKDYQSTQTVTLLDVTDEHATTVEEFIQYVQTCIPQDGKSQPSGCNVPVIDTSDWAVSALTQGVPQALYGDPSQSESGLNPNPDSPTVLATVGISMHPKPPTLTNGTSAMEIAQVFEDRVVNADDELVLVLSQTAEPVDIAPQEADSFLDIADINDQILSDQRTTVFDALQAMGLNGWSNDPLPEMAANPGQAFADEPLEGSPIPAV